MDDLKDRRYMHRVSIPSALLYFREIEKPFLLSTYQGPFQITDISKRLTQYRRSAQIRI